MKRNNGEKIVTFGVKMPETAAAAFQSFCKSRGMEPYGFLTLVVQNVISMHNMHAFKNEMLREVLSAWDDFEMWQTNGSVLDLTKAEVLESIYIIHEKCHTGGMAVLVEPSVLGEPQISTDKNEIIDSLFSVVQKGLNKRLRKLSKRLDTNTITETITALCEYFERSEDDDHTFIQDMFSDNCRHDFGRKIEYVKYRRHNHIGIQEPTQLSFINDLEEHEQGQELQETDTECEVADAEQEDEDTG